MTPAEFAAFKTEAIQRGFSHVITSEGPVLITKWRLYGGIEELIPPLTWLNQAQAVDFKRPEGIEPSIWGSVWTFLPEKRANEILEYESNVKRRRK